MLPPAGLNRYAVTTTGSSCTNHTKPTNQPKTTSITASADSYLGSPDDLHHVPDHQVRRVHFQLARKLCFRPVGDEDRSIRTEAKKLADLRNKASSACQFSRVLLSLSSLLSQPRSISLSASLSPHYQTGRSQLLASNHEPTGRHRKVTRRRTSYATEQDWIGLDWMVTLRQ